MVDGWNGILPDQFLGRDHGAEVAHPGTHIAVGHLEPRPREGVREFFRVLVETPRDRLVDGVHAHGHVRSGHDRCMPLVRIVGVGHGVRAGTVLGYPLVRPGGTRHALPLVAEQDVEVTVVPRRRVGGPCAFDAAGDGVAGFARAVAVRPAETLHGDFRPLGFRPHQRVVASTVALAEGVPAGNKCHGLLVVHRHAGEGLADVAARGDRIGIGVGSLGIHVDQAHLDGAEGILEVPFTGVALVAKPLVLGAPVDVVLRLPDVRASPAETERLEAHRLERAVAREDHQIRPGELAAVFLLDRP